MGQSAVFLQADSSARLRGLELGTLVRNAQCRRRTAAAVAEYEGLQEGLLLRPRPQIREGHPNCVRSSPAAALVRLHLRYLSCDTRGRRGEQQ